MTRRILCVDHNNTVAKLCDEPISTSLALFVNAFEVLKGDGTRGTTFKASFGSGQHVSIDARRRTRAKVIVDKSTPSGVPVDFHAPSSRTVRKMLKEISVALPSEPVRMEYTPRQDEIVSNLEFGFGQFPGILKIAFHFASTIATNSKQVRETAVDLSRILFHGRSARGLVKWIPLESIEWGVEEYGHTVVAWQADEALIVAVNLFGFLPLAVRLDHLQMREPQLLTQRIDNGGYEIRTVSNPSLDWQSLSGELTPELRQLFEDAKHDAQRRMTLKNIEDQVAIAVLVSLREAGSGTSDVEEVAHRKFAEATSHAEKSTKLTETERASLSASVRGVVESALADPSEFERENAWRVDY